MSDVKLDSTRGLIELAGAVSHDEAEADWYDVYEYIETLPRPEAVLKDLIRWVHEDYL